MVSTVAPRAQTKRLTHAEFWFFFGVASLLSQGTACTLQLQGEAQKQFHRNHDATPHKADSSKGTEYEHRFDKKETKFNEYSADSHPWYEFQTARDTIAIFDDRSDSYYRL
jgi:hypothetical protein